MSLTEKLLDYKSVHVINGAKISCECAEESLTRQRCASPTASVLCCSFYSSQPTSFGLSAIPGSGKYCCPTKGGKQHGNKQLFFQAFWSRKPAAFYMWTMWCFRPRGLMWQYLKIFFKLTDFWVWWLVNFMFFNFYLSFSCVFTA